MQKIEIQETIKYGLQGTGIPCTRCVSHTGYGSHGNSKGEIRGRSRHDNHSKIVARKMGERNVGTIRGRVGKVQLSPKDLTIGYEGRITSKIKY